MPSVLIFATKCFYKFSNAALLTIFIYVFPKRLKLHSLISTKYLKVVTNEKGEAVGEVVTIIC